MAQTWTDDVFAAGHVGQTDLQNMENNFTALKSMFSGASAPANPVAGMPWFDTTKKVMKQRNAGDSAWIGLMHGDTSQKMWVYRNAAMDGWAIDSSVTDKVLALKGGSTYTTGGASAGSWTLPDHTLAVSEIPSHNHTGSSVANEGAHTHPITTYDSSGGGFGESGTGTPTGRNTGAGTNHTHALTIAAQGGGSAHNHGATFRPAAAVGTLQYLDL